MAAGLAVITMAGAAVANVTFYEDPGYRGRSYTTTHAMISFDRTGFNDKVSSIVVRGGIWEFCEDLHFSGRCVVLRPGRYPSMRAMGLNDRLSSARPARRGPRPRP
jgi:hypothetical protein